MHMHRLRTRARNANAQKWFEDRRVRASVCVAQRRFTFSAVAGADHTPVEFRMSTNQTNASAGGFLHAGLGSFSSTTASRARTQTARFAVERSKKATSANRRRVCSTAIGSASQDTQSPSKTARGKCHEIFKSRLQSQHWPRRSPTRLVRQAALLFKAMPGRLRSRAAKKVTTRTQRHDLLPMAIHAAD
jgi:hypothetical protein